jgi:eukaryotic-like serine/threonine-protein kinase
VLRAYRKLLRKGDVLNVFRVMRPQTTGVRHEKAVNQGNLLHDPFGLVGTLLEGQYRVDAVVGEGGFGVVYQGRHLSLDQPIAIKVLKGLDGGDPRINALVLEKFRAEARLLYTLSQSSLHIVRALDFGAATTPSGAWAPFMILEWLDGRSLADDLAERRRRGFRGRSLGEVFALVEPVVDGLAAAHQQQVAHRDVKPANIFLLAPRSADPSARRPGPTAKVLDFGIAKIMKEGESAGTKGTFASFTWLYAAPEQLDPRIGATGLATDVYAFALLLTELLTDQRPVDERDVVSIMRVANDPNRRPTPRTRGANIPDEIEAICRRALAIDPKARFASISELWAALVSARDGARGATTMQPPAPALTPPASALTPRATALPGVVSAATPRHGPPALASTAQAAPPFGTRPPGLATPPPMMSPPGLVTPPPMMSPPLGTAPPGTRAPMMPYGPSPPRGTAPPGYFPRRMPFVRADGTSSVAVVTVVFFVLATLFAGSCALVHGACSAM